MNPKKLDKNRNKVYVFGEMVAVPTAKFKYPVKVFNAEGKLVKEINSRNLDDIEESFNQDANYSAPSEEKSTQSMLNSYDVVTARMRRG